MRSMLKRPTVYLLLVLIAIGATTGPAPAANVCATAATSTVPIIARYSSATYGYALPLPTGWTRIPAVRWLPLGPAADLTAMTPDHTAAIGVLVSPLGNRVASDAYLQSVADRFIAQEDEILSDKIYERRAVINGVSYRVALATLDHGGELQASSWMLVLVTARHHRLYAFAGLAYDREVHFPVPNASGSDTPPPTPTDTPIVLPFAASAYGRLAQAQATVPLAAATPASQEDGRASAPRPASLSVPSVGARAALSAAPARAANTHRGAAIVRTVGHEDPARCPEAPRDIFPPVVDKNCALHSVQVTIERSFASITIDPRAADDARPAPSVGLDNFTPQHDAADGFAIDYPARWTPWPATGVTFAVRAPDRKAFVAVDVRPAGAAPYAQSTLRTIADRTLEQLGHVIAPVAHAARRIGGQLWVVATPNNILFDDQRTPASANAEVAVTVARGRIYLLLTWDYITGPGNDDRDIAPRFFAPFYPLARAAALDYFATNRWAAQLEDISANSLTLDPRAPVERRPAPAVGVDGFTRHVSTANGYDMSYAAQWKPMAGAGAGVDLDVGTSNGSVRLGVEVRPATGADADPRAVADREMAPYLKGGLINQPSTYNTVRLNGQTWLVTHNERAETEMFDEHGFGHYVQRDVTILVAVKGGRLYVAAGWVRRDIDFTTDQNIDLVRSSLSTVTLL